MIWPYLSNIPDQNLPLLAHWPAQSPSQYLMHVHVGFHSHLLLAPFKSSAFFSTYSNCCDFKVTVTPHHAQGPQEALLIINPPERDLLIL